MSTTGIVWEKLLADKKFVRPTDPYFVWADMTDFVGYFDTSPTGVDEARFLVESVAPPPKAIPFQTQSIRLRDVGKQLVNSATVSRWQLGLARGDYKPDKDERTPNKEEARVLAAVLDDGCPMFNLAYARSGSATSIRWIWNQGRAPTTKFPDWRKLGPVDGGRTYGAELGAKDIDAVVNLNGIENDRYRSLDYLTITSGPSGDPWKPRYHGASVLSQVSGNPSPESRLGSPSASVCDATWPTVFVQFPSNEPLDTTGAWLGVRVFDGLRYVIDRAKRAFTLPGNRDEAVPIVACISYGGLAGPHDGSSMLERAMLAFLDTYKHLRITLPAGNAFGRAVHAIARTLPKKAAQFAVFAPPDCPNPCFVEIWAPEGVDPYGLSITLTSPDGQNAALLRRTGVAMASDGASGIVLARKVAQGTSGTMILVAIQPTRMPGQNYAWRGGVAKAGVWKVAVDGPDCVLHAWIERDDIAGRVPRAQQARFVGDLLGADGIVGSDARIDEKSTLSSIANAVHDRLYVVGSTYAFPLAVSNGVSPYSASGPSVAMSPRTGPDLSARSDVVPSLVGVMVDGVRSGDRYRSSGTSVAAGIAARYLLKKISTGAHVPPASPSPSPRLGTSVP